MYKLRLLAAAVATTILASAHAEPVDANTINRIADEGFNHGQVVQLIEYLSDHIGGRMTNSPAMREAERWTQDMYHKWGLQNVHKEGFDFGRGWWIESASTRMVSPRPLELVSIPVAWTPATKGAVTAPVIVTPIRHERDLETWKGKVKGKIVMITYPDDPKDDTTVPFKRLDDGEIGKMNDYQQPNYDPEAREQFTKRAFDMPKHINQFFAKEGALAIVKMSYRPNKLVHGEGYLHKKGETVALPEVEMAQEDYRRLARLAKTGEVKLEVNSKVHFDDHDMNAYNVLAEIPGTDPKAGYVMAGAHLDSWVAGDGSTDNGAGSAVVMEAARILSSLGVKPKRTIRFALWAGEEQGLYGSMAYINQHLATRPTPKDPLKAKQLEFLWDAWPVTPLPGYNDMAAYFNLDNGSGKIRGIYAEGNFAAVPTLRNWMAPFDSMGANHVVAEHTYGTDHQVMAAFGLPAFQFIQDPLDYGSRAHHSNLDTFDHLRTEDLRQAAVIMATMLMQAAEADKPMPRNVVPHQPDVTNPFKYLDPAKD
ncbi:MAG: M20/M25/M40 family metallo-hydrolase [Telluria sp.]